MPELKDFGRRHPRIIWTLRTRDQIIAQGILDDFSARNHEAVNQVLSTVGGLLIVVILFRTAVAVVYDMVRAALIMVALTGLAGIFGGILSGQYIVSVFGAIVFLVFNWLVPKKK